MSKFLLRIGGVTMAHRESVAGMSFRDFDLAARHIAYEVALSIRDGIREAAKRGGVQVHSKKGYKGTAGSSVVTELDTDAQKRFMELVKLYKLPKGIGYLGEENNLRIEPKSEDIVVTIDPLDGTNTLVGILQRGGRLQPFQVSVMIGLQIDGVAVASYICDLATLTVYVRGAFGQRIVAFHPDGSVEDLANRWRSRSLGRVNLLRHGSRYPVSGLIFDQLADHFRGIVRGSDSFGLSIISIADGTCGALLRPGGGNWTPWDDTPVNALCRLYRMGDSCGLAIFELRDGGLREMRPSRLTGITPFAHDLLYIDRRYVPDLMRSELPVRLL